MIADQVITRLEYLHSLGWVHRDLKPDNLMTGIGDDNHKKMIYLIDFGLAKTY